MLHSRQHFFFKIETIFKQFAKYCDARKSAGSAGPVIQSVCERRRIAAASCRFRRATAPLLRAAPESRRIALKPTRIALRARPPLRFQVYRPAIADSFLRADAHSALPWCPADEEERRPGAAPVCPSAAVRSARFPDPRTDACEKRACAALRESADRAKAVRRRSLLPGGKS